MLDILVVATHPDDAELGMGGAIVKFKEQGLKVGILDLTSGEPTPFGDPQTRALETASASRILGVEWRQNLGLPNRSLEPTLDARRALAGVIRTVRPRILFAPYWVDAHPDHVAASQLCDAAGFWAKLSKSDIPGEPHAPVRILYYFSIHLRIVEQPSFVLDISAEWEKKLAAIKCFQSQFEQGRVLVSPTLYDRLRDRAAYWGWTIGTAFGEPFASREPIGITDLRGVL